MLIGIDKVMITFRQFVESDEHVRGLLTAYHGVANELWVPTEIKSRKQFGGFHCGSIQAAKDRILYHTRGQPPRKQKGVILRVVFQSDNPYLPNGKVLDERINPDRTNLWFIQNSAEEREKVRALGHDVVPYYNGVESPGSLSFLILDPKKIKSITQLDPSTT